MFCYGRDQCIFAGDSTIDILDVKQREELKSLLANYDVLNCYNMISRPRSGSSIGHVYSNICGNIVVDLI